MAPEEFKLSDPREVRRVANRRGTLRVRQHQRDGRRDWAPRSGFVEEFELRKWGSASNPIRHASMKPIQVAESFQQSRRKCRPKCQPCPVEILDEQAFFLMRDRLRHSTLQPDEL